MKNKITTKVKSELKSIIDNNGYWSEEVKNYIAQFEYNTAKNLHSIAQVYSKYQYGL